MKQKLILTIVIALVLGALLTAPSFAAEIIGSGSAGSGTTWTLDDEGTLVISGSGSVTTKFSNAAVQKIVIGEEITQINENAFAGCSSLEELTINANLVNFNYCDDRYKKFASVNEPFGSSPYYNGGRNNAGNNFANNIFGNCKTKIKTVTFGEGVKQIGAFAFVGCIGIEKVAFSDTVTEINQNAFQGCTALKKITIPDSVALIGDNAFSGCVKVEEVSTGDGVTSINSNVFNGCSGITKVELGNSITTIGGNAFQGCSRIIKITLPDTLQTISSSAFANCSSLESITIPSSVIQINENAFAGCSSLEELTINANIVNFNYCDDRYKKYASVNEPFGSSPYYNGGRNNAGNNFANNIFGSCKTKIKKVTFGDGVTQIGGSAFAGCTGLEKVVFSDKLNRIYSSAFSGCGKLRTVYYEGSESDWKNVTIGGGNDPITSYAVIHYNVIVIGSLVIDNDEYCIHVVDENDVPIQGAEVEYNVNIGSEEIKKTNQNGDAVFGLFSYGNPAISVSKDGRIPWTNRNSWWSKSPDHYEKVVLYPEGYNVYKLIHAVYYNDDKGTPAVCDLLKKTKKLSIADENLPHLDMDDGIFHLECQAADPAHVVSYILLQNSTEIAEATDGLFELNISDFTAGGACAVRVVVDDGRKVDTTINLVFEKCEWNKGYFDISLSDKNLEIKVGDSVPLFGGQTLTFPKITFPVSFEITEEKLKIGVNYEINSPDDSEQEGKKEAKEELYDYMKQIQCGKQSADAGSLQTVYAKMQSKLIEKNPKTYTLFGKIKTEHSIIGYLEGNWKKDTVKGFIMYQLKASSTLFETTQWVYVVPVTVNVGVSISAGLSLEASYDWQNATFLGNFDLSVKSILDVFGGVGVGKYIGAGAYGSGSLDFLWRIIGQPSGVQKVDLSGEFGFKAYLASFEYKKAFAHNTWHLYTANSVKTASLASYDEGSVVQEPAYFTPYNAEAYAPAEVSYLENESGWLGEEIYAYLSSAGEAVKTTLSPLLENTYRNAQPTMISAAGNLYGAFLREDADTGNIGVYITKSDGITWTEPVQAGENAYLNGTPVLLYDGESLWLAFTETTEACEDDLLTYALNQKIMVGQIDPETLAFTEETEYTGSGYLHSMNLRLLNGVPTLAWIDAEVEEESEVLFAPASEICYAEYDGVWGESEELCRIDKPVLELTIGLDDGELAAACAVDEDRDALTGEDRVLKLYTEDGSEVLAEAYSGRAAYGILPGTEDEAFLWNEGGSLITSEGESTEAAGITAEYSICGDSVYYSSTMDSAGANLTVLKYQSGHWGAPMQLTEGERYLENLMAAELNGSDYVLGMHTKAEIYEDEIDDSKDLVQAKVMPWSNLILKDAHYDWDKLEPGAEYVLEINVQNNGDHTVREIEVFADGEWVHTEECDLEPGETAEFSIRMICPYGYTEYTIEVEEPGETDYTPDDNSAVLCVGYGDLEVSAEYQQIGRGNSIVAYIENTGIEPLEGMLTLYDENDRIVKRQMLDELGSGDCTIMEFGLNTEDIPLEGSVYRIAVESEEEELTKYNNEIEVGVFRKSYTVTAESSAAQILFTVDEMLVKAYDTAAFTVEVLEEGAAFTVQDEEGDEIPFAAVEEGRYTFTMPDSNVIIGKAVPEEPEGPAILCSGYCGGDVNAGYDEESEAYENLTWILYEDGRLVISGDGEMRDYFYFNPSFELYSDQITSLEIESGVTNIANRAFEGCYNLTSVAIPDSVINIGDNAFMDCGLTSVIIPNSVISIGVGAFEGCGVLTSITISEGVASIGNAAFECCYGLTGITIPSSVTSIGECVFSDCYSLMSITVAEGSPFFSSKDGILFNKEQTVLIQYPIGDSRTEYIIPDSVTGIGDWAFYWCSSLTSVTIPDSVTSIGDWAFSVCENLESVYFEGDVPATFGSRVFDNTASGFTIYYHEGASGWTTPAWNGYNTIAIEDPEEPENPGVIASGQCGDNLTWTLTDDGTLTISGEGNMWDYDSPYGVPWHKYLDTITRLNLNEGITRIGRYAFYDYSGFTGSLTIPESVTSIGDDAFWGCSGFTGSLTIPDGMTDIGSSAFYNCKGFTGNLTIPDSVTNIGNGAFMNCSGFTGSLTIPASMTDIGGYIFCGCSGFSENLLIPDSVTSIGDSAFFACTRLTGSLTIPNSVTSIGDSAFAYCSRFTGSLTIPDSVTYIGSNAFGECDGFKGSLTISDSVTSIGSHAFWNCDGFTGSLTIPDAVTDIGSYAFCGCFNLTGNLVIPESVISIGEFAFWRCYGFTGDLIIPDSVTCIGDSSFEFCTNLESVYFEGDAPTSFGTDVFSDTFPDFTIYFIEGKSGWTMPQWNGYNTVAIAAPVPAVPLAVTVESVTGYIGNTVRVPIILSETPGLIRMSLQISYDPDVFTLIGVEDSELLPGGMHSDVYGSPYSLVWENDTAPADFTISGTVAELVLEISDDAEVGDYTIGITVPADGVMNLAGDSVDMCPVNGVCTVCSCSYIIGDVNGDGNVTSRDRLILARYLADWEGYELSDMVFEAADVNSDSELTNKDRLILARHLADWEGYSDLASFRE